MEGSFKVGYPKNDRWMVFWLVVTGCHEFYFPINIGFRLSSQLTNSYFSEGWPNHQPVLVRENPIQMDD